MVLSRVVTGQPDEAAPSYCVDKLYKHVYIAAELLVLEANGNPGGVDATIFVCLYGHHRGPPPRPLLRAVMQEAHKPAAEK
jgi:hypothetical protein